jgi:hypothetical protein
VDAYSREELKILIEEEIARGGRYRKPIKHRAREQARTSGSNAIALPLSGDRDAICVSVVSTIGSLSG